MDHFISLVGIEHVFDRQGWTVNKAPIFHSDQLGMDLTAPVGTHTDLASVPRLVWFLIPPMDKHVVDGAVIHDWLYQHNGDCGELPSTGPALAPIPMLTRKQCDQVLRDCCIAEKSPAWYKTIVYLGVRLGGWWPWLKYKKARGA